MDFGLWISSFRYNSFALVWKYNVIYNFMLINFSNHVAWFRTQIVSLLMQISFPLNRNLYFYERREIETFSG